MRTFLSCTYYDLAGKNISMEGRRLVLTLFASNMFIKSASLICFTETATRHILEKRYSKKFRKIHKKPLLLESPDHLKTPLLQNNSDGCFWTFFLRTFLFLKLMKMNVHFHCDNSLSQKLETTFLGTDC